MPALDVETLAYAAIWDALNGNLNWKVPVANQVRYDQPTGTTDPEQPDANDGDYPRARLWAAAGDSSLYTKDATFGTYDTTGEPPGNADGLERQHYIFRLEMISDLLDVRFSDRLRAEALNAFRIAGPRLGVPYITSVRTKWIAVETDWSEDRTQRRWKTTMDIYIQVESNISILEG